MDPNVFQVDQSSFSIQYTSTFTLFNWRLKCENYSADCKQFYFLTHIHIFSSHYTSCMHSHQDSDSLEGDSSLIKLGDTYGHIALTWPALLLSPLVSSEASQYWHCLYPESGDSPFPEWAFWQVAALMSGDIATTITQLSRNIEPTSLIHIWKGCTLS